MRRLHQILFFTLLSVATSPWNLSLCNEPIHVPNNSYGWKFLFSAQMPNWNHNVCTEYWAVMGDTTINDKTYKNLFRDYGYIDGTQVKGLWNYQDEPYATGVVISLREENGRVLVPKEQYISLMQSLYPEMAEPYLPISDSEDELLLYDFTLHEGDLYPCKNHPWITKVTTIQTTDGISHKVFFLSNGYIIIEGIGCINSLGTLVLYQNHDIEYVADNYRLSAELIEYGLLIEPYIISNVIDNSVDIISIHKSQLPNSQWYDLSGRRVSPSSVLKGVFIKGGKKVVKE